MKEGAPEPWYVAAFRSDYRAVYPHRDLAAARREAAWILERGLLPDGRGRALDLCCGFGRHSLALSEVGVDVVGLDLSTDLLGSARALEGGELLAGRLVCGDARRLPFRADSFDGVINLFTSFGYFGEEGDREVLIEVARVLRSGGRALFDLMNPDRIRRELVPYSKTAREGIVLRERRALADGGRRVTKDVTLTFADGAKRRWREDVRMYSIDEFEPLARAHGLRITGVDGDFQGAPPGPLDERQIVWVKKEG